jgi:hypothetical protein
MRDALHVGTQFDLPSYNQKMCDMKTGKFTLLILAAATFAACSKDKTITEHASGSLRSATTSDKETHTITAWESGYGWTPGDSSNYRIQFHDRATPEITDDIITNGAVLVWAKNIPADDGSTITKPQILPLAVIPDLGRPAYNNYWYFKTTTGNVTVKFRTNKYMYTQEPAPLPNSSVQFRYFIIPRAELDQYGYTQATISRLTYEELTNLLGTPQ